MGLPWAEALQNCAHSLGRVLVGTAIATVAGVAAGLARHALPAALKRNPLLVFLMEAPKFPPPIAWIPFVILGFGIGELAAVMIVFIGAFPAVFTATYAATESTPTVWLDTADSLEVRGWKRLTRVLLPAALPQILVGIRSGLSMGWMSVIAAELISGQSGLGYSIQLHRLNMQYDGMVLDMVLIGFLGWALFEGVRQLERVIIPWHVRAERA